MWKKSSLGQVPNRRLSFSFGHPSLARPSPALTPQYWRWANRATPYCRELGLHLVSWASPAEPFLQTSSTEGSASQCLAGKAPILLAMISAWPRLTQAAKLDPACPKPQEFKDAYQAWPCLHKHSLQQRKPVCKLTASFTSLFLSSDLLFLWRILSFKNAPLLPQPWG